MKFELIKFSNVKNLEEVYYMYKSIPQCEMGSTNKFYNDSYDEFIIKFNSYIRDETILNTKINSCCTRYIFYVNNNPIGELGIRTTLSDFWVNRGSQIFYKILPIYRNKGYGTIMLNLALEKCMEFGFKTVRINCDDKNIASKKIIERNGGKIDIKGYKTKDGTSSSYIIYLNN